MKKKYYLFLLLVVSSLSLFAQEQAQDTIAPKKLQEVIVIGQKKELYEKQTKPLTTVDDYL